MSPKQKFVFISVTLLVTTATSAFTIHNTTGAKLTIANFDDAVERTYSLDKGVSQQLSELSPPWKAGEKNGQPMLDASVVNPENKQACTNLASYSVNDQVFHLLYDNSTLTVNPDLSCTISNSGGGSVVVNLLPNQGQVNTDAVYTKNNPLQNLGLYTTDNNPHYDYKDPNNSVHFTVTGLPTGLDYYSWGHPANVNPNDIGMIYSTGAIKASPNCLAVAKHPGYFRCPITVTASDPGVTATPSKTTFDLYLYNGLRAKTLQEIANYDDGIFNQGNPGTPILTQLIVKPTGGDQILGNVSNYFTHTDANTTYSIDLSINKKPWNIVTQTAATSAFKINGNELVGNFSGESAIYQLTIRAQDSLGQTAEQTIYVNASALNHDGKVYTLLKTGNGAWIYDDSAQSSKADYAQTIAQHQLTYAYPDMGWLAFNQSSKFWDLTLGVNALDNNYESGNIAATGNYYKQMNPQLNFVPVYEMDTPVKGYLPILTDTLSPAADNKKLSPQDVDQVEMLADNIATPILNDKNAAGLQFDVEPFPAQPRAVEFYQRIANKLERQGKIFEVYAFSHAMRSDLMLAMGPLGVLVPSSYDVGGDGTDPATYAYYTSSTMNYQNDNNCHPGSAGANSFTIASYCNLDYNTTRYNLESFFGVAHTTNPNFGKNLQHYSVHFQNGVPAEGSAQNWSSEMICNPTPLRYQDGKAIYPSIVASRIATGQSDNCLIFNSEPNPGQNPQLSTQAGYINTILDFAKSVPELGTPASNTYNIGLALYALQNEKIIGCKTGESHGTKANCIVELPIGVDNSSDIWPIVSQYTFGTK